MPECDVRNQIQAVTRKSGTHGRPTGYMCVRLAGVLPYPHVPPAHGPLMKQSRTDASFPLSHRRFGYPIDGVGRVAIGHLSPTISTSPAAFASFCSRASPTCLHVAPCCWTCGWPTPSPAAPPSAPSTRPCTAPLPATTWRRTSAARASRSSASTEPVGVRRLRARRHLRNRWARAGCVHVGVKRGKFNDVSGHG